MSDERGMPVWLVMVRHLDGSSRPYDWRSTERMARELAARLHRDGLDVAIVRKTTPGALS